MSIFEFDEGYEGETEVNLHIIITPMLDMAFQLLAFFIMTFHPSGMEAYISGKLLPPEKVAIKGAKPQDAVDPETVTDEEPQVHEVITVIVKAVGADEETATRFLGEPTEILIRTPEMPQSERIADTSDTFDRGLKKLYDRLVSIRQGQIGGQSMIKLNPDGELKNGYVVRVWDVCRAAGFRTIGFLPPAPPAKK